MDQALLGKYHISDIPEESLIFVLVVFDSQKKMTLLGLPECVQIRFHIVPDNPVTVRVHVDSVNGDLFL